MQTIWLSSLRWDSNECVCMERCSCCSGGETSLPQRGRGVKSVIRGSGWSPDQTGRGLCGATSCSPSADLLIVCSVEGRQCFVSLFSFSPESKHLMDKMWISPRVKFSSIFNHDSWKMDIFTHISLLDFNADNHPRLDMWSHTGCDALCSESQRTWRCHTNPIWRHFEKQWPRQLDRKPVRAG